MNLKDLDIILNFPISLITAFTLGVISGFLFGRYRAKVNECVAVLKSQQYQKTIICPTLKDKDSCGNTTAKYLGDFTITHCDCAYYRKKTKCALTNKKCIFKDII